MSWPLASSFGSYYSGAANRQIICSLSRIVFYVESLIFSGVL